MTAGRGGNHRRGHGNARVGGATTERVMCFTNLCLHTPETLGAHVRRMVGVEHELNPATLVFAVQLGVAVVVTNHGTATNPLYGKDAKVIP